MQFGLYPVHQDWDIGSRLSPDIECCEHLPGIPAENIESERLHTLCKCPVVEVHAYSGNLGFALMSQHLIFDSKAELVPCRLIENEYSIFAYFVTLGEIPSFNYFYSHKIQEIPLNGIAHETDLFSLELSSPSHSVVRHYISIRKGDILYFRIALKFGCGGLSHIGNLRRSINLEQMTAVEAHFIVEHILPLHSYEAGAYYQHCGNYELEAYETCAEGLAFGCSTETAFEGEGWRE